MGMTLFVLLFGIFSILVREEYSVRERAKGRTGLHSSVRSLQFIKIDEFQIIKGMFRIDDYDFCVAHTDMASSILPLRGILKSRFPNKINGMLPVNIVLLIKRLNYTRLFLP